MRDYLIIHPNDETTDFLKESYQHLENKLIVNDPLFPKSQLRRLIRECDNIILLGHGSEFGLFSSISKRQRFDRIIVGSELVDELRKKNNVIGIFCHARNFFEKYNIKGFATGMFISDLYEADMYSLPLDDDWINESNTALVDTLIEGYNKNQEELYHLFDKNFSKLSENQIADFNLTEMKYFL